MGREVELKLELDPSHSDELARQALFARARPKSQHQVSVYYDTPGGKLRKNGYSLRVRSTPDGFVQTVKTLDSRDGLFFRGEWEAPVDSIEPEVDQLQHTPAGEVGAKRLQAVVSSAVERTSWRVKENGAELEVAFDAGDVRTEGRGAAVCELEIELKRGDPSAAFAAARRIAHHVPLKLGVLSKAERGFALADNSLGKVSKAPAVSLNAEMTAAEGFAAIVQSCLKHFRLNEPLVVRERDADALHQARVAMRRLRSALSLFRPAVADGEFERLREELRWFTGQLGEARNLDVYLECNIPKHERRRLMRQREETYDAVIEVLNSRRFSLLMIDLMAWVTLGRWRLSEKAQRPLSAFAERRIGRLWLKIAGHGDLREMDDEERHQLRIEIKKLRYALDFMTGLHSHAGQRQKRFTKAIEALQEVLGRLNDIVTARQFARNEGDPEPAEDDEVTQCVREAAKCLDRLKLIGPYWSSSREFAAA